MLDYSLLALALGALAALVGAASGLLAVRWFLSRYERAESVEPIDQFVAAQIDQAAVNWATTNGRPEAAGIMADKLHLLHRIGQRRRRWQP